MDIQEAEEHRLLPGKFDDTLVAGQDQSGTTDLVKEGLKTKHAGSKRKICEMSITYVLETTDAGIGRTLMGLWIAYGLAKEEDRAFFIDDTHWYISSSKMC